MKTIKLSFIIRILLFLISSMAISNCWAHAVKENASSYRKLLEIINHFPAPDNTLLVLDDDDTLTMMPCSNSNNPKTCQYIGGPAWFDWQVSLPENSPDRVAKSFNGILDANTLLFTLTNMPYTETDIPMILYHLTTQKKVKLIVETSRGFDTASATARQFGNLPVTNNTNLLSLIDKSALKVSRLSNSTNPFQPCDDNDARAVSYQQGVFYVVGQNKGQMLRCLFKKTDSKQIKNIIFMDDTQKNVDDVYNEFLNDNRYNVVAIYYTRLENHKKAFTEGEKAKIYQQAAKRRWKDIKRAMQNNFIEPALPIEINQW